MASALITACCSGWIPLFFRAPDRTLTADEASESRAAAVALAAERFGAVQR